MAMIDPVTRLDPEVERMTAQAIADLAYSLWGADCEAVRISRSEGIEPRYRPELVMMAKADEVHRKAHEDCCAMAAGKKVAKPNKSRPVTEVRRALKAGLPVKSYTVGAVTVNLGKPETAEPDDAWNKALGL